MAFGLSILFYVMAQRELGNAKTSAFYAFEPFVGAILSLIIILELPAINFYIAIIIMVCGSYFASTSSKDSTEVDLE